MRPPSISLSLRLTEVIAYRKKEQAELKALATKGALGPLNWSLS